MNLVWETETKNIALSSPKAKHGIAQLNQCIQMYSNQMYSHALLYYYEFFIALLENVNKSRTSAGRLSFS
jgi:hypothetical protein